MKILITGVAGFLGSHLAERLIRMNHRVVGVDNMLTGYKDNIPKNVDFFNFDCCDLKKDKNTSAVIIQFYRHIQTFLKLNCKKFKFMQYRIKVKI